MKKDKQLIINSDNYIDKILFFKKESIDNIDLDSNNRSMFSSKDIWTCHRRIIGKILYPPKTPYKENIYSIRYKWLLGLERSENPLLMSYNCIFQDHRINLYSQIDFLVKINSESFILNFECIENNDILNRIKYKNPLSKDVLNMVACLYLSDYFHGLLIYQNNQDDKNETHCFHIQRCHESEKAWTYILMKCKSLNESLIKGKLPEMCIDFKNKSCKDSCQFKAKEKKWLTEKT